MKPRGKFADFSDYSQILKPTGDPPPKGTVPAYLLYVLSFATLALLLYAFVVIPCCCPARGRRKSSKDGPEGMMVLPVQQLPETIRKKKKKGKKKTKEDAAGGVSVNLIVDPTMFSGLIGRDAEDSDDGETQTLSARTGRRRRGLFEGLAMEEQWKVARKSLKRILIFDIALFLLWVAEFVMILLGKRCSPGGFEGW